jgi:O-antigen/teichoic acid export membrane protein
VLLIVVGRAAQFILALVMMRVVTTILPPFEMGRMALFISATAFFALFLVNPVGMFINRRLHAWETLGLVRRYLDYYWAYLLVVAVLASAILSVMNDLGSIGFQTSATWLWVLVCGSLLLNTANQTVIPSLNLLGFRGWFIGLTLATLASGFLVAVVLLTHLQPRAEYWLLGLLVGQAVFAGIGGKVFFARLTTPQAPRSGGSIRAHIGVLFGFAWPVSIAVGMNWVQSQSYRFFMEDSLGLAALGLFVAGYGISAGLIAGLESVFTTYFQPIFYKHVSGDDRIEQGKAWTSYASAILPSMLLVGFFVAAAAPELTRLLLGVGYKESSQFVAWGAIAEMARVFTGVYGMVAHARMKTSLLLVPNAIGAVISITMMLWLMPKYGAVGAGFALALAGIAVFLATYIATRKELVTTLPYSTLLQCVVVGAVLAVVASITRQIIGPDGIAAALMLLSVLVIVFLLTQYWILRSFFDGKDKTNE